MQDEWDTDEKKRLAVVSQLGHTVLDLPFAIPFCICLLCPWRIIRVFARILDVLAPFWRVMSNRTDLLLQPTRTDGQKRQYILASAVAGVIEYIGAILGIALLHSFEELLSHSIGLQ